MPVFWLFWEYAGFAAPIRLASEAFDSGRNAEYGESREYGFPTLLDADFDELRSEVALLVAAAEQRELLILARPQRRHRRLRPVVAARNGEVEKAPNHRPEFAPLPHGCFLACHIPPGC